MYFLYSEGAVAAINISFKGDLDGDEKSLQHPQTSGQDVEEDTE